MGEFYNESDIFFENNHSDIFEAFDRRSDIAKYAVFQTSFYVMYITIFLLGVFGNCLVCYTVFKNRHMQSVTNYFIANLALSDILQCVLAVPFTPIYFFMGEWIFGSIVCRLVSSSLSVSVYVSTLTLTSIAIDRYYAILHPFKSRLHTRHCYLVLIGIWIFSLSATFPYGYYIEEKNFNGRKFCEEQWPSEKIRRVFSVFTAIMQFIIPFIIILFCYIKISLFMKKRIRCKPGSKSSQKDEMDRERKRRTNRMLIGMVTIFGISWLPMNVIHLVGDYYIRASTWKYYNLCFFISHVIAMSSTCYNPLLYAWLNENFRKEFKIVLPCFTAESSPLITRNTWRSDRTVDLNNQENIENMESGTSNVGVGNQFHACCENNKPSHIDSTDANQLPVTSENDEEEGLSPAPTENIPLVYYNSCQSSELKPFATSEA